MISFTSLVEAQAHARTNAVPRYYRVICGQNSSYAGGWLSSIYPREQFFMVYADAEAKVLEQMRRGNRVDVSTMITSETSNSINAR